MDRQYIRRLISQNEGRIPHVYPDSLGIPTIGVGFNLERPEARQLIEGLGLDFEQVKSGQAELDQDQIDVLLDHDIDQSIADARIIFANFDELDGARQAVLVDMTFNLGRTRLQGFRRMIAAVEREDFEAAVAEMIDSSWHRQVGQRARDLEASMRDGSPVRERAIRTRIDG